MATIHVMTVIQQMVMDVVLHAPLSLVILVITQVQVHQSVQKYEEMELIMEGTPEMMEI